ncbi:50S ribosomal protein L16 [Candidatus Bathyarchaeota archaeon]|jgi:large subunit ribosomal protein L10e|nr:MAG: 50S ribosomal protein L16 [Candidatus Bathyarchaeota archaeon]
MKGNDYKIPSGMPYVRREYIKGPPQPKITKFVMGDSRGKFPVRVRLVSERKVQITHNALEAARIATNKALSDKLGEKGYCLRILVYPHVVLRENKMMAFAGADRIQEGMRRAFGKPVGLAARVKPGQPIMEVDVNPEAVEIAKESLRFGASKLPTPCLIQIEENKQN